MKKTVLLLVLLISVACFAQAQTTTGKDTTSVKTKFSPDFTHYVLYVLKSEDQYEEVLVPNNSIILKEIDGNDIQSADVLKGESAIKEYGSRAENGAIVFHFKKGKFKRLKKDLNDRLIDGK
jgi:hypothetical protein